MSLSVASPALAGGGFSLREHKVHAPEMGEILTYILVSQSVEYSFVPPFEWRVMAEPERQRVMLTSKDRAASISMAFVAPNPALSKDAALEMLRPQILSRFPQSRIIAEFPCYTGSYAGRGFDVEWTGPGEVGMSARVALFAAADSTIEFTLNTMTSRFRKAQSVLGGLLTSFQKREEPRQKRQ